MFNLVIKLNANDDTYINSSNIIYNEETNIVELAENSKINIKNTNILIDKGIIDYNKNKFEVFGNFYLYEELTILSGENLKGNTSLNNFSASNVSYIYNNDLKIDSYNLDREENFVYFYNNFLTPCELEGFFNCPTWSLRIDKTKYNIDEDKFTHFDTFLQIADYKVFYLPYFSHYGAKAPRKKGFLTPSIEFTIGSDQGIIIPYYIPLNQNTDILLRPKISLNQNFEFLENYELSTTIENKRSGGNTYFWIDNVKRENNDNLITSLKIETKQVIDKNSIFSASGLFTNSISTTRSINDKPVTFEDIYLRSEKYNFLTVDDYLKTELASVESFDSIDLNSIPISPSFSYSNFLDFKSNTLINQLDFIVLSRDESSAKNPSESYKLNLNNELVRNYAHKNKMIYNKLLISNSYSEYFFNNDQTSDHNSFKSHAIISSEINYDLTKYSSPKFKFIIPLQIEDTNKSINEDSESITFNYQNQFSENRFFGNDLLDSSPRFVYGLENILYLEKSILNFNINQSLQSNTNNTYSDKVNQRSKFSDYALEKKLSNKDFSFKIDARLDQKNYSIKEMNYSLNVPKLFNLNLEYNETQTKSFKNLSDDSQSLILNIAKKLNNNMRIEVSSNLDVKNDYDPYKSSINLSLFDECSQLDISYSNTRFNDNFHTQPREVISFTFSMDYLGFWI